MSVNLGLSECVKRGSEIGSEFSSAVQEKCWGFISGWLIPVTTDAFCVQIPDSLRHEMYGQREMKILYHVSQWEVEPDIFHLKIYLDLIWPDQFSTTIRLIAMKFWTEVHSTWRMNLTDFCKPINLHLGLPPGQRFHLSNEMSIRWIGQHLKQIFMLPSWDIVNIYFGLC